MVSSLFCLAPGALFGAYVIWGVRREWKKARAWEQAMKEGWLK